MQMAFYRDINALAKDTKKVRSVVRYLLTLKDVGWTDWEIDFLEGLSGCRKELSTRQAEKLVELRDNSVRYAEANGFRFSSVLSQCWLNRFDLSSEEDIEFIEGLKSSGNSQFLRREISRLRRCAVSLGELEPHQHWDLPVASL